MTTIGATSYYNPATRYPGTDRSNTAASDEQYANQQRSGNGTAPSIDSRPSASVGLLQGTLIRTALDLKAINVSELSEDRYQAFMEMNQQHIDANRKYLESQYTQTSYPDYSNDPRMQNYATITVRGNVVATIDNQGVVSTNGNAVGDRINEFLNDLVDDGTKSGPESAQFRADKIAEFLGGRIVKSDSTMTQAEYDALAPFEEPTRTIDYEAMKLDPLYDQLQGLYAKQSKIEQQRAEYLARQ